MMLPRPYLADSKVKKAVADSRSWGQMPNSSTTRTLGARYAFMRRSRLC